MNLHSKQILQNKISLKGKGLHTGLDIEMTIKPGEDNVGIKFIRVDQTPAVEIPADANLVVQTQRGTVLEKDGCRVSTVEHILSVLFALGVEDAVIEINGPEIPILDGSSKIFGDSLISAGLEEMPSEKQVIVINEIFEYVDPLSGAQYVLSPSDKFDVQVITKFSAAVLGEMTASCNSETQYLKEIAPSRTFVLVSELEPLVDAGLIKGGDIDNALVINDKNVSLEEIEMLKKKLDRPNAEIRGGEVVGNNPMTSYNEPAKHKLLDLVGDLALVGKKIQGKIIATKPGHTGNVQLAKFLKQYAINQRKLADVPKYNPNDQPIFNIEDIKRLLPHRFPFLMVDKIIDITQDHIVGVKNVTGNEAFFQGHFPGNPVLPGVLQMEALAQVGGILALHHAGSEGQWDTYFLKMDNVKFKAKVMPGDTLLLKMVLMNPIRRGIVQMYGTAYVGNKLVSEGELTAQIVKREE